jgi:hypothetical protein
VFVTGRRAQGGEARKENLLELSRGALLVTCPAFVTILAHVLCRVCLQHTRLLGYALLKIGEKQKHAWSLC